MQIYANMHLPHHFTTIAYICKKYAKNMHVYEKYVSMKFICIICTSTLLMVA